MKQEELVKLAEEIRLACHYADVLCQNMAVIGKNIGKENVRLVLQKTTLAHCKAQELDNLINGIEPPKSG